MRFLFTYSILMFIFSPFCLAEEKTTSNLHNLNLDQCIAIATEKNASVDEANANIEEFRARLAEVQANFYPKLSVLGYVAPMFTVTGDAFTTDVDRDFSLGAWGPSTHLEALFAMPIYTFGRLEAGELAAKSRLDVEKSRLREAQNHVKVEVSKFYYSYLYASTILPHLIRARDRIIEIQEKAQELYDEATGKVTKIDLMKLRFANTEIQKYILLAEEGKMLALSALKHTMGLENNVSLTLVDKKIKKPGKIDLADEATLVQQAIENRPEWEQIRAGLRAVTALRKSEKLSNRPVIFVAGTLVSNWSPTRDDAKNPYHYDPYNDLYGGVAIGLKLDFDWALQKAKVDAANATMHQVNAKKKLAITGIPLQIMKSRSEVMRYGKQIKLSKKAVKASNKWIVFAGAAYASGTGEVKDVLEGMAAMLSAQRDYYEGMLNYYVAFAELNYSLGK